MTGCLGESPDGRSVTPVPESRPGPGYRVAPLAWRADHVHGRAFRDEGRM